MRNRIAWAMLCCCLLATAPSALAQANATGSINGQVTDASGGAIAGAQVVLTDVATKGTQQQTTNDVGRFVFLNLPPGIYDVTITKQGFRTVTAAGQVVTLSKALNLNLSMEVGATTQTVEIKATAGAELQTVSSTMGSSVNNVTLLNLPSINRDVSALLNLQATAAPTFHGAEGDITGGSIAGSTPDQNTFILDGSTNTSGLEGDNGYINGFSGDQRGVVPTPIESIGEVTVNTNNMTADFNTSSGGELLAVTKRGNDAFHGAVYDYFQGDWLNSNSWGNNFNHFTKFKSHQNRYGVDASGPMLPRMLGGKTYFFVNYEAQRYPFNITGRVFRTVPSDLLRAGIIQIKTSQGIQSFDLSKPLNVCGPTGGLPCDPRNTGLSTVTTAMWNTFMPEPNFIQNGVLSGGDHLNTFAFQGRLTLPLKNDEWIGRIDHDFGAKNRWFTRYSWFKQNVPNLSESDIGGLLPGDTKGKPASASSNNNQPGALVTALDTTFSPTLTNSFHFGYTRNEWNWIRRGVVPQIAGSAGVVEIDNEGSNALIPINVNTQASRNRAWYEHNWDYRDELTWLKGNHLVQFGGDFLHEWWHFNRFDNVVGGLTTLIYEIDNGSIHMTPTFQPQLCAGTGGTATTQCIDGGKAGASERSTWNRLYADLLGIVNHSTVVATRTGANLQLLPFGTPAASYVKVNTPSGYVNDSWKVRPGLTLNLGLNYTVQFPPFDVNGRQDELVDASTNQPLTYQSYVANRIAAANQGKVYFPTAGFSPVGAIHLKYPFKTYYGDLGPRVSVAWSPSFDTGWMGTLFGHKTTVIRGGYGRFYGRDLGINIVSSPILGDGFLQPVSCTGPSRSGACLGQSKPDPTNAFRMGTNADGLNVPLPPITQTLSIPVQPGVTAPYAVLTDSMDQNFRPNSTEQIDFSIQRQLKGDMIFEIGYLGVWGHHLFQGIDMGSVPWMMKLNGQTFAQAYAGLWKQLNAGVAPGAVTSQPWFEAALAGTGYCAPGACTAAVAANEGPNVTSENVTGLWSDLDGNWNFGPALYSSTQSFFGPYANTSLGLSNYNAMVVKLTKRTTHGLTMNVNATYGHALGTIALAQTYTLDTPDNVYDLRANWTPQPWDRKFTFNLYGTYELPFGPGQRWSTSNGILKRLIGGWIIAPLFVYGSGLPMELYTGSFGEMGASFSENGASAIPVGINTRTLSNSVHNGITVPDPALGQSGNPNSVGINGNADNGGTGANMFGNNVINVYNSFRPFVLGIDGAPSGDGNLRGPTHWVFDLGINKDTRITERVGFSIYGHMFNAFNHTNWNTPSVPGVGPGLDLQDPQSFGVMRGGYGSFGNYGRVIELGARVSF